MRSLPGFINTKLRLVSRAWLWQRTLVLAATRCALTRLASTAHARSLGFLVLFCAGAAVAQEPAESLTTGLDLPTLGKPRVVLLKNDRCLTGIVRQLGDKVVIEVDENARISKPASEIQTIADDIEAVYRFKLSKYPRLGPGEHIRMARWSMANGLYEHASHHFLVVNREAGQNPVVRQLGIELREQLLQDEGFRSYLGLEPAKLASTDGSDVRPVSTADAKDESLAPILPTVLTSFADHVQPILLKRCSQSGCHGFSSSNRLKFVQPSGNARARLSEQNCRSALQFVEVDSSNVSVLLRYAVVAHGLQKEAAITPQEKRFAEIIEAWTTFARNPVMAAVQEAPVGSNGKAEISGTTAPAVYSGKAKGKESPAPLSPLAPGAMQLKSAAPAPGTSPAGSTPVVIPGSGGVTQREIDQLDDMVRKALGEPPRSQSTDPFDPAEFNRRSSANNK